MRGLRRVLVRVVVPLLGVALVPLVGSAPAHAHGAPIDLGTLYGGTSGAWAINNSEQIVGTSDWMPVVWLNRQIHALPLPDGYVGGTARDINNYGTIVGHVWTGDGVLRAITWSANDLNYYQFLEDHTTAVRSGAYGISDSGVASGFVNEGSKDEPATFTEGIYQLLDPVWHNRGVAYTMSMQTPLAHGQQVIVGNSWDNNYPDYQYPYENGIIPPSWSGNVQLPAIFQGGGAAWAVNRDASRIFGNSNAGNNETHPTMWTLTSGPDSWPTWTVTDLGLPGGGGGNGYINDSNWAGTLTAGSGTTSQGTPLAFYWQEGVGSISLSDFTSNCGTRAATGVNQSSQIVGWGCTADGAQHALFWN
jgi:hypothetical protein